ncbi:hypothetical protein CLU79DRAFT_830579 [Phycomyces nitens]|nr:hypothetical protein CLU79DRAFT_830579 [Phycomyces nitens]
MTPKSILKQLNPSSPIGLQSSSWLSRIQSKIYSTALDDPNTIITLPRQELKRVTFSVSKLTSERIFYSGDDPEETPTQPDLKEATLADEDIRLDPSQELPKYYEKACRMREEPVLDRFLDVLRLNCFTRLTTVDLSNKVIDRHQAGPIADILMLQHCLTRLSLSNCALEDETIRVLLNSLLLSDTLPDLDLSSNPFKAKGFKYISIFISQSRALKSLSLSRCTPDRNSIQHLSQAIQLAPSLHHLDMDECGLKPGLLEILSEGVRQSTSLASLSLCNNRITHLGAVWIAAMLLTEEPIDVYWQSAEYTRRGLQRLDLTNNTFQHGLGPVAQALYNNQSLLHLSLKDCHIGPDGCSLLAEALLSNQWLQTLDLSGNPLGKGSDDGIQSLKTTLARSPGLIELNLADTALGSSAAIALAEALPENSQLTRLDLSRNPLVTMAGVLALSVSIRMNDTLTFLDINIPPNDLDLAQLQNDIVAVCTRNMQRTFENNAQTVKEDVQSPEISCEPKVTCSSSTISSASSASSSLSHTIQEHPDVASFDYSKQHPSLPITYPLEDISLVDDLQL